MAILKEDVERSSGSTVIGQSILISGRLTGDEDLTVRGRLEGELTLTQTLVVEPTGIVKANVSAKNAIISGVVVGNIIATESVELTREGRRVGDIRAPRIIIAEGASYRGHVDMGEVDVAMAEAEGAERSSRPVVLRQVSRSESSRPPSRVQIPVSRPERATSERRIELKPSNGASSSSSNSSRPPAPPPVPPLMAQASKRKVVFKRKR